MKTGLGCWFKLWHQRYRNSLIQLLIAGTLASILAYVQNDLLALLTQALAGERSTEHAEGIAALFAQCTHWLPTELPAVLLGLFVVGRLVSGAIEFWKSHVSGKLTIQTKDDLETEILLNLLRKEDSFFSRHSPAETVNRLAVDLYRVSERRPNLMKIWWSALLLFGNLVFFFQKDWRLALVAIAACGAGVAWTICTTKPVKELDDHYLQMDDNIKSRFEDLLRTAPEVQTGALFEKIRQHFRQLLGGRSHTFLKYIRLNGTLRIGSVVSYLLAFVSMIVVVLYMRRNGAVAAPLALVPVVIYALPELFGNASELVFLRLEFQIARASMDRLLEYEAQGGEHDTAIPKSVPAEPLHLNGVTYRYTAADGTQQGGMVDVTTQFAPGRWTTIVGGAGSGKSTLLKLILGRLAPQAGDVQFGKTSLAQLPAEQRAALFSLMPQSIALLNTSIAQNLLFGRPQADSVLTPADIDVIEQAGLGKVCRLKALDMVPVPDEVTSGIAARITELRSQLRTRLRKECGTDMAAFEDGHSDPQHWVLECLLAGRCDRKRTIELLLDEKNSAKLQPLVQTAGGARLVELGRSVLRENHQLLSISNYHVYAQLSPFPLDERLWRLRTTSVELTDKSLLTPREARALCVVGLTSSLVELAGDERATALRQSEARTEFTGELEGLQQLLAGACQPFTVTKLHPNLTWRENLIFGVIETRNSRSSRLVDETVLDFVQQAGLRVEFTRLGLEFEIGRLGGNLSGGQCQLVALCRALLRRTPVIVLDEPTSALDPSSRAAVAALLQQWKADRVVVTVSHDVEFIRQADEIRLIEAGRLVGSGTFAELESGSEPFRRILKQK